MLKDPYIFVRATVHDLPRTVVNGDDARRWINSNFYQVDPISHISDWFLVYGLRFDTYLSTFCSAVKNCYDGLQKVIMNPKIYLRSNKLKIRYAVIGIGERPPNSQTSLRCWRPYFLAFYDSSLPLMDHDTEGLIGLNLPIHKMFLPWWVVEVFQGGSFAVQGIRDRSRLLIGELDVRLSK